MSEGFDSRLARIEERLIAFGDKIDERHEQLTSKITSLCTTINTKQEGYDKRLVNVENEILSEKSMYKGRIQFLKWLSLTLGIFGGVTGLISWIMGLWC